MTSPIDDKQIISLYKKGANEQPSVELDQRILSYAQKRKSPRSKKVSWSYIGLAASILFVALLAPWQWQKEAQIPVMEHGVLPLESKMATERQKKSVRPERPMAKSAADSSQVYPLLEATSSPFEQIEKLLEQGKQEQARQSLLTLLTEHPELQQDLPPQLRELLQEP